VDALVETEGNASAPQARATLPASMPASTPFELGRPIAWTAALVYAGSWLAATERIDAGVLVAALCIGIAAAVACALAWPRPFGQRTRIVEAAALALILASAAALRASSAHASSSTPSFSSAHASSSPAAVSGAAPSGAAIGRWSALAAFGDDDLGTIDGSPLRYVVPAGSLADGDLVAIGPIEQVVDPARGPIPGPNAARGVLPPRVAHADEIVRLAPPERAIGWQVAAALSRLRRACVERALALSDPLTGSLVAALLFGDTRALPDGVPDLFVRTGTYHVLAISGLQVALVAMLLVWPLGSLAAAFVRAITFGRFDPGPLVLRVVLLTIFVPVAGAGAPVVRSAIAWGLGALAPCVRARRPFTRDAAQGPIAMGRRADSIALWSLALLLECLAHPDSVASLSVQLSYAATAGLIFGTSPIVALARSMWPGGARIAAVDALGRPRSPLLRISLQRAIDGTFTALAASTAAVLATLPFTWARFGEWSPIGVVATALLVIPVLWMLVVGWVWIVVPALVPEVALDAPARAMVRMLELFDRVPGSPDVLPQRPAWLVLAAVVLTFAWLHRCTRTAHEDERAAGATAARSVAVHAAPIASRAALIVSSSARGVASSALGVSQSALGFARSAAAAWVAILVPWTAAPRGLELWALDVGSGTAVVWRAPGAGAWVFDAGSRDRPDVTREALLPLLREWEATRLTIVLSHADRDHDGGLPYLALRIPPTVWAGALPAHCAERLPHTTARLDVGIGTASICAPATDRGGLSVSLERGLVQGDNEGSRTARLAWAGEEIVLCGDAEADGLRAWLAMQSARPAIRLLLSPHHGSDSELLGPLLAATRPAEVWVSGPVEIPIRAELDRRRLSWRWTARDGPLHVGLALGE
jgi:competence protein ComEC